MVTSKIRGFQENPLLHMTAKMGIFIRSMRPRQTDQESEHGSGITGDVST
jgi:hypothetical protein